MGGGERKVGRGEAGRGSEERQRQAWVCVGGEFGVEVGVGGIDTATVFVSKIRCCFFLSDYGLRPALSAADCDSDVALREGRDCNCSS